ncbi:MAG: amidohydrolase family protein [Acidimicrobiia bacterium]|nr:amidohydrolase family protein [Acidimicrobiia bacterium]
MELTDYPTIDVMNHLLEVRSSLAGNPFEFREFQIMLDTTFKALSKPPPPAGEEESPKKKRAGGAGMLAGHATTEECLADMDELGYTHISVCATKMWSYYYHRDFIMNYPIEPVGEAVAESGGRIIGTASYDPFRVTESCAEVEHSVKELGFRYVWFHPLSYGLAPNDRRFYPLYAKCVELDIPVGFQVGQSAEVLPSDCGRPMLADDVAIEFPDLRINLSHTGWPWVDEWCSMLWRHPNVFGDISAYYPHSLDDRLVRFMDSSRGRHKVLFGTNGLGLERCKAEFLELEIAEETKRAVLHDNAVRFFALNDN